MWKLSLLCFLLLCSSAALVAAQGSRNNPSKWQTLTGSAPLVIARGGFSGLFPDSSLNAYGFAVQTGSPNLHVWCDVQLTKDGRGICFPDIRLENASDIDLAYPKGRNTYVVNGVSTQGWFSVDFTLKDLGLVNMRQRIYSRAPNFDGSLNQIQTVEDVVNQIQPPALWLSVPHDAFFSQHNQSMRSYIISVSRNIIVSYVSSPEVGFLRSVASRFRTGPTKLVFQFLGREDTEPTTNQTYGSLLTNLTFIKTFARGILIPKSYIWPVDNSLYLQDSSPIVVDAHAAGLEVFASNFANDAATMPYNYSYDPVSEYLSFIDNGNSSVDGVLSDFPITASATVDCYAHLGKNDTVTANVLVISNEGASGDYPGCTDKAYEKAVSDGVDILDCPVQITNDGIPFCLGSINLRDRTTAAQSDFINRATNNPDLAIQNGIFTYNLTWSEIQSLRPAIYNPYSNFTLFRNPKAKNDGNLMQLSDFLTFANASSVSGVIISIEDAAYLAKNQGLGVTDVVLDTLSKAGFTKKVMIRSSDSAVLSKFKSSSNYELVYLVDEDVRDILNSTILEIKKFASSVVVSKKSVFPTEQAFLTVETNVVPKLQAFNISVYVQFFRNEFVSQPWDFFSDPYVEINTHYSYMGINGVITDFPATAARFKRNRCLGYKTVPPYMSPVQPGGLLSIMAKQDLPPAEAPNPILTDESVIEPPLPPVKLPTTDTGSGSTAPGPVAPNGQSTLVGSTILSGIAILVAAFVLC
ncbi:SHV3-like 1 [Perilla frutescens var. hirtella]|uniref:glycerophosphodiester phosphodiesterase n=1 Tax=Perilla frutescens var. hirtella TaxID=608512 RepID=A0AAD4JMC9_PERFH|nr:SHV3-like 1 [Perilla frutescens var. hirtella]